jgi:hypothetical protein
MSSSVVCCNCSKKYQDGNSSFEQHVLVTSPMKDLLHRDNHNLLSALFSLQKYNSITELNAGGFGDAFFRYAFREMMSNFCANLRANSF